MAMRAFQLSVTMGRPTMPAARAHLVVLCLTRTRLLESVRWEWALTTLASSLRAATYLVFVFERFIGSDVSGELVARRMRHTPNLPVHMVFSEGAEVYSHNYKFVFTKQGRVITTSTGKQVPLYMGAQTKSLAG